MSGPKMHRWDFIQRMPVIRRVIRKAGQFACGICRTEFATYNHAYECLDDCWHEVQNLSPVVRKQVPGVGLMYRCRFCSRDYNSDSFARNCAAECRQKQGLAHLQDAHAAEVPLPQKKRVPRPARPQPVRLVQPRRQRKEIADTQELQQTEAILSTPVIPPVEDTPPPPAAMNTDLPAVTTTTMAAAAPQDVAAKARSKKDFKDLFYRNGAKYLCRFCNAEFFTKMEVEACFNNHFDANGYEKH